MTIFVLCLSFLYVMHPQALTPRELLSAVNLAKGSCSIPETTTAVQREQLPRPGGFIAAKFFKQQGKAKPYQLFNVKICSTNPNT